MDIDKLDQSGVDHEYNFWQGFVKTDRFLKDWCSLNRTNELNDLVYDFLTAKSNVKSIETLDVGSGPVSLLRGTVDTITTCDPLSPLYQKIVDFKSLGISPPEPYAAENLPEDWNDRFLLVHCSNALDHCKSPWEALKALCRVCRPGGGLVILQGFVNEADHENRAGFHQWNIELSKVYKVKGKKVNHSDLRLSNPTTGFNRCVVPEEFGMEIFPYLNATVKLPGTDRNWFVYGMLKK